MALFRTIVVLMIGDHRRDGGADADDDGYVDCWGVSRCTVTRVLVYGGGDCSVSVWWW